MSLDDLFSLLIVAFVALSFVSQAVRGARRRGRGQPPASPRPQPNASPSAARTAAPASPDSAFERRLEEARRRVRQASAQEPQLSRPSRRSEAAQPSSELVGSESAGGFFQMEPTSLQSAYAFLPSEGATARASIAESKPLQVQRKRAAKRDTLGTGRLGFGGEDLLRGLIWQQILNEPRAKAPHGRNLSRRP